MTTTDQTPTLRRFDRPHRPPVLRIANHLAALARPLTHRLTSLQAEDLVTAAAAQAGHDDFELPSGRPGAWRVGMEVLTTSLEREARLTPTGRYFARGQLLTSLTNRLALRSALLQDPHLAASVITPPIVIVGLPRSGTTLLQHLLARDVGNRALYHWEAPHPVRDPGPEAALRLQRAAEKGMRLLDYLAPDARALHPVAADEPTECVTLFANSFASLELATINQVPGYLSWCTSTDMRWAYEEYRLQLQVLQGYDRRPRWLLKSPAHLFWLEDLLAVLPGARIVQIHRDPLEVIGSFCSLAAVLAGIGSDHVDLQRIGSLWAAAWADGLARARRARRAAPAGTFVDVQYPDLVADPVGTVRSLYRQLDLDLDPGAAARMQEYLGGERQRSRGVHAYSLAQFGLDTGSERARFVLSD